MSLEVNESLKEQSASNLRPLLISEIQEFIAWLELKMPVEQLTAKRDRIRGLLAILAAKEHIEFHEIVGRYFPDFAASASSTGLSL